MYLLTTFGSVKSVLRQRSLQRDRFKKEPMPSYLHILISVLVGASVFGLILWKKGTKCLP